MTQESIFDRFIADIRNGRAPNPKDVATLERRAAALHNFYPNKITKLSVLLRSSKQKYAKKLKELEHAEKFVLADVTMEKDENGKPKYFNADLRKIEVQRRLASTLKTKTLATDITKLEISIDASTILLERARQDHFAWIALFKIEMMERPQN